MVTQQLFGEACRILEVQGDGWLRIECAFDRYEGWCAEADVSGCDEEVYHEPAEGYASGWVNELEYHSQRMLIPMGSTIRRAMLGNGKGPVRYKGNIFVRNTKRRDEISIREITFPFLNTSYLWGGKSVFGIDCSGFSQTIYKFLDHRLQRDAYQQEGEGIPVERLSEARCGDLAFFNNAAGMITHVGILLNNHEIIHASGKVRIDRIDDEGILHFETFKRTHQLTSIKRYW